MIVIKKDGSIEHFEYENGKLKTTISSTSAAKPTSSSTSTYVKSTTSSSGQSSSSEIKQLGDYYGEVINNVDRFNTRSQAFMEKMEKTAADKELLTEIKEYFASISK